MRVCMYDGEGQQTPAYIQGTRLLGAREARMRAARERPLGYAPPHPHTVSHTSPVWIASCRRCSPSLPSIPVLNSFNPVPHSSKWVLHATSLFMRVHALYKAHSCMSHRDFQTAQARFTGKSMRLCTYAHHYAHHYAAVRLCAEQYRCC
jgi:hypothetical protein